MFAAKRKWLGVTVKTLVIGATCHGGVARAETDSSCAKAAVIGGSGCEDLAVEFDLTSCGGSKHEGKVDVCRDGNATASATAKGKKYTVSLTGKGWGGKLTWTASGTVKENQVAEAEKPRSETRAKRKEPTPPKKEAKAEPAPLPVEADSVPPPPPAQPVVAPMPIPAPVAAVAPPAEAPKAVEVPPLTWSGDFRYRHEALQQEKAAVDSYRQDRIRARLNVKAVIDEDVFTEFRIATGSGRVSTNQTLGANESAFNNYDFKLDRAYFNWTAVKGLNIIGGKQPTPFFLAGGNDLMWDSDVNFDGAAVVSKVNAGPVDLFANASYYWLDKSTAAAKKDVMLNTAQLGVNTKDASYVNVALAVTAYKYRGIKDHKGFGSNGDTNGNSSTTVDPGTGPVKLYKHDYELIEVGLELSAPSGMLPMSLFADHVQNNSVETHNKGRLVGMKIGKLKSKGDWAFAYDHRVAEKDAMVGAFTDGDSFGGGVDARGHRVGTSYQAGKNWNIGLTYFDGETKISIDPLKRRRTMLDFNFKF